MNFLPMEPFLSPSGNRTLFKTLKKQTQKQKTHIYMGKLRKISERDGSVRGGSGTPTLEWFPAFTSGSAHILPRSLGVVI